ncbi:coiled-coil domain-containing protein 152-like [Physella acuta]|uniref:coiled-coil domain-containing protein 152-like n=1 Tax=Physella acuta TaxID=109671 RepID=UPI0027DDBA3A|nr:coiled-coil domain-containing protein 152-like [Physella acuta]
MELDESEKDIVKTFDNWCKNYTDVLNQSEELQTKLKQAVAESDILKKTNTRLQSECQIFQETIKEGQNQMESLCNLEEKLRDLRCQLLAKDQALQSEVLQHRVIIQELQEKSTREKDEALNHLMTEYKQKLEKVESLLKNEEETNLFLKSQLEKVECEKKKELCRLTSEYERKLAVVQQQKAIYMQQQHQLLNQEVMRKKMQHMKETHDKEIAELKSQLQALQEKENVLLYQQTYQEQNQAGPQKLQKLFTQSTDHQGIPSRQNRKRTK